MIAQQLTDEQRVAVEAPYDGCVAITGAPGTGKSSTLTERLARLRAIAPDAEPLVITSQHEFAAYAVELLRGNGVAATPIDDVEAELLFTQACEPLFGLQWEEFASDQLDPEVPGLRSPQRFLESAFRLIRRLRDADVEPSLFLSRALTGATEFYAQPPNFADPSLLSATRATYHDSLDVTPEELLRQHRREVDLAKILAKVYAAYVEIVNATGRVTGRDATIAAADLVRSDSVLARRLRNRHRFAFIDDAESMTNGQLRLLTSIFGENLAGVTLCGDPSAAISPLQVTRPEATFRLATSRIELQRQHRSPAAIEQAVRRLMGERGVARGTIELHRAATMREEAAFIAQHVSELLERGAPPNEIAVLFRSVRDVALYEAALLDRGIPAVIAGDANVFADRRALDALALLWNVHDPFRHDWLLRTLSNPAFGLSDASLAILCGEPDDPQRPLFTLDDEPAPTTRVSRWDPKRDLRLGWNVIRGERDDALPADAAARVERLRRLREGWLAAMQTEPFATFARRVWSEGLAREGAAGSPRARAQQVALERLLDRLRAFLVQNPGSEIGDVLAYAEARSLSDLETCEAGSDGFVQLISIEAARGREFDHVVVANVHPGGFPLWYAPDAFLFSERLGMIPKENAGEAAASRTAKFAYYMFRAKAREGYNARERRALVYALRRARTSALVTASGTPTKGITAPEFLEELR
ncbi:MAG: 3'-5' exonuclease [Candidatus Baltobacteraceae bacterium]